MLFLYLASLISGLPMLYPISKFIKKKDITMMDLLMLFSGLYFVIIPITSSEYVEIQSSGMADVFAMYSLFSYSLLAFSLLWDQRCFYKCSIINVSRYFNRISDIRITSLGYIFLGVSLVLVFSMYVSKVSFSSRDVEEIVEMRSSRYGEKSILAILAVLYSFIGLLLSLFLNVDIKKHRYNIITIIMQFAYILMTMFLPRRVLLFQFVLLFVCFYSLNRKLINTKLISFSIVGLLFLYTIYFPFYNVIRNNNVVFDKNSPVMSFVKIVEYGVDNWDKKVSRAKEVTDSRSIGVYDAVLQLAKADVPPQLGSLTYLEIDVSIPKVLNPDKGVGSELVLEQLTRRYTDIADSFFLLSYGDFKLLGGVYCVFLFILIFFVYSVVSSIVNKFNLYVWPLFMNSQLISYCWNIEGKLSTTLTWFYGSFAVFILVYIIEKNNVIRVYFNEKKDESRIH